MNGIYELVGRAVLGAIWRLYGRQIRAAGAFAVVATAIGAGVYLASREGSEQAD